MTKQFIGTTPVAMNAAAVERHTPTWERLGSRWQDLDRLYLTEKQAVSLTEKVMDTRYFSSEFLLNPSIEEFALIVQEEGKPGNTYIAFRPALLEAEDIRVDVEDGIRRVITPAVDAYVYMNNGGRICDFVLTLARCVLEYEGSKVYSSTQFLAWSHPDPYTQYLIDHQDQYFVDFTRTIKGVYMGIQMLSLERPEIVVRSTMKEVRQETVQKKGRYKKVRKTCLVRTISISAADLETFVPRGHHTISCPCWGVAGHWRHYKSGKKVWVKPHRKGRDRRNHGAYQPKEYTLPKEV